MTKPSPQSKCVLAIDPGRRKCGLAVLSAEKQILHREVVPRDEFGSTFRHIYQEHSPTQVLLGGSTGSKEIAEAILQETEITAQLVDERHTTELAKLRYFKEFPPRGLWKLVPIGLRNPPTCYDDFAAVVLAERYLEEQSNGT